MKIEELSNYELFRTLVNYLWNRYDSGGISVGRSYQATLLEGFMDMFHFTGWRELEGDIRQDVQRRILLAPREYPELQEELPFSVLETLSNTEFALLSLTEMCRWHREDAEKEGYLNYEHRWVTIYIRVLCELSFPEISQQRLKMVRYTKETLQGSSGSKNTESVRGQVELSRLKINNLEPVLFIERACKLVIFMV
jgi:hypothetical protein